MTSGTKNDSEIQEIPWISVITLASKELHHSTVSKRHMIEADLRKCSKFSEKISCLAERGGQNCLDKAILLMGLLSFVITNLTMKHHKTIFPRKSMIIKFLLNSKIFSFAWNLKNDPLDIKQICENNGSFRNNPEFSDF